MTMPSPRGNTGNVMYNPGALYAAPLATAEPTDLTTAWGTGWTLIGYTDAGSQFDYQWQSAEVKVEEELDILANAPIGRVMTVRLAIAEFVARTLQIAYNGGTLTPAVTGPPAAAAYYEPPDFGQEQRIMVGYESEDSTIRIVFRRTINVSNVSTMFKRAPQKATLPVELRLERLVGSVKPFRVLMNNARYTG